jgi:hypothetical protein
MSYLGITLEHVGLYFARLWYFEELYPLIFAIGGLSGARDCLFDTATMSLSDGRVIGQ